MADTNLSQAMDAADGACFYDTNIKFLLADKQVLARILKYAVREFKDMSIEDIMSGIGDDIKISKIPLDAGLSNLGRVKESGTEDNIPGEGKIFFDIRFTVYHKEKEMKFLINLEAQRSSRPGQLGYLLENRIVFYLARMISAQKYTEFFGSDYDSLKKVRSIWICLSDDAKGDSIEEIYLDRKTVYGNKKSSCETDLMRGIIINVRPGQNISDSSNVLISMLENLISRSSVEEKKRILTEKYGMIMSTELEGKVRTMCNWSEAIKEMSYKEGVEKGIEKGIEQGIEKGIEQGIEKERLNAIGRMIQVNMTKTQIISCGYSEKEFAEAESRFCNA